MIGLELPGEGSFSFHLMFSLGDQAVGGFFSPDFPLPVGPLNPGQFSAWSKLAGIIMAINAAILSFILSLLIEKPFKKFGVGVSVVPGIVPYTRVDCDLWIAARFFDRFDHIRGSLWFNHSVFATMKCPDRDF